MAPAFPPANWPQELITSTLTYLTLPDLQTLRLASKALAALVAQEGAFKQCYLTKHLDVSPEGLRDFVHMTRPGLLGAQVEHLVLTGLAVNTEHLEKIVTERARWVTEGNGPLFSSTQHKLSDEEVTQAEEGLAALRRRQGGLHELFESGSADELLAEAFENIAASGKHGKLSSLTLDVAVLQEDVVMKKRPIETRAKSKVWQTADAVFCAAIAGLARIGLPVEKFDAFTGPWHCSLGWSSLGRCVERSRGLKLAQSLHGLQSLSLSLSADMKAVQQEDDGETEVVQGASGSIGDYRGLADLLALCPWLSHLHLHWFVLRSAGYQNASCEKLLQQANEANVLHNLRGLTLRGLRFQESILPNLLRGAPIKDLRLENVSITDPDPLPEDIGDESEPEADVHPTPRPSFNPIHSASWDATFAHCSSAEADMSSIYFDDLIGGRFLHFKNVPGGPKMPWTPYTKDCPTLDRKGEDVRREIEYTYARGRPLGSPQQYRWGQVRQREYGPA